LELLANILGAIANLMIAALEALGLYPWGRRAKAAPAALPEDTIPKVVAALQADEDAAAHLPRGWQGFYSGLIDETAPDIVATVPIGAPLQLVVDRKGSRRQQAYPVAVELPDRSAARIGRLERRSYYGDSIDIGEARCWFAKHERTLLNRNAAVVFVAVYVA
jgi:hypothetical protein